MIKVRNPSLELNWLPNSMLKNIPTPEIYMVDDANYGGCYYHISSKYKRGRIIIVDIAETIASTIAHEWRHCWQNHNNNLPEQGSSWEQHSKGKTYKKAIISYFKDQPFEMDALLFELKHAPNEYNLQWYEWILNDNST